jgi:hypothetical protein
MPQSIIAAAISANADFNRSVHQMYEAGQLPRQDSSLMDYLYVSDDEEDDFDREHDALAQAADAYIDQQKEEGNW